MGGKPLRHDPLFQTRLAGKLALRIVHQALQVTTYRQARLIPTSNLGVKFPNPAHSLAEQF